MLKQLFTVSKRYKHRWLYGLLSLIIAISISLTTSQPSYGGRSVEDAVQQGVQTWRQYRLSDEQEVELGKQINDELIKNGDVIVLKNPQVNSYLNEIGQRLAKVSERPQLSYTLQIVDDDSINAFATMGGFVYINRGTILTADNETELASVISHEMGHITGRHALSQMRNTAIAQGILTEFGLDQKAFVQLALQYGYKLPLSRRDELAADKKGLTNLKKAGYAPIGMLNFMEKLLKLGGSSPSILSTHPDTKYRLKVLQKLIDPNTARQGDGLDSKVYKNRTGSI
jgi:predicted Zn-dependent protease